MNKKALTVVAGVLIIAAGGGIWALTNSNAQRSKDSAMMSKEDAAMAKTDDAMAKDDAMKKDDAMAKNGSYVTLADYNANQAKYADTKKVYYFYASWCPDCQNIEKQINADMSKIPSGVTLIKTDFDAATELRQKYGVTIQHTFVQVDNNGNQTAKWSATSLTDAVAGIQ